MALNVVLRPRDAENRLPDRHAVVETETGNRVNVTLASQPKRIGCPSCWTAILPGSRPRVPEILEEPRLPAYAGGTMSHALSISGRFLDMPTACGRSPADSALSPESQAVRQEVDAVVRPLERSQALFGPRATVIAQVWALVNECAEPGWDGERAEAVDRIAALTAGAVIRALPSDVPLPEAAPDPDGSISLDWIPWRSCLFSLSIDASSRLAFAWADGSDCGHGVASFDGARIPNRILQGIGEITRHGNSTPGPS